jgi:hypothetical protein
VATKRFFLWQGLGNIFFEVGKIKIDHTRFDRVGRINKKRVWGKKSEREALRLCSEGAAQRLELLTNGLKGQLLNTAVAIQEHTVKPLHWTVIKKISWMGVEFSQHF